MLIYIKVNNTEYPAAVSGVNNGRTWDGRDTKTITLTMTHDEAAALLPSGTPWSIVRREMQDVLDEQGKPTGETKEVVNTYLCQRTGEAAGGTIVLQYMSHELIGNYFTEINM